MEIAKGRRAVAWEIAAGTAQHCWFVTKLAQGRRCLWPDRDIAMPGHVPWPDRNTKLAGPPCLWPDRDFNFAGPPCVWPDQNECRGQVAPRMSEVGVREYRQGKEDLEREQ